VIRPEDDTAAIEFSGWWNLVQCDHVPGNSLVHLRGEHANRAGIEERISDARLIVYFGHGSEDSLHKHQTTLLIDAENVGRTKGAIVVAIACNSATSLADQAIAAGAVSYLGFLSELLAIEADEHFGVAAATAVSVLMGGGSVRHAEEATKDKFTEMLDLYRSGYGCAPEDRPMAMLVAQWNLDNFKAKGDLEASLII
jgi:hypothetical protein